MDMDKPHFLSQGPEIVFLRFKDQVPFKSKKNISPSMLKKDLSIDILYLLEFAGQYL
jgi:hypothetical protein